MDYCFGGAEAESLFMRLCMIPPIVEPILPLAIERFRSTCGLSIFITGYSSSSLLIDWFTLRPSSCLDDTPLAKDILLSFRQWLTDGLSSNASD